MNKLHHPHNRLERLKIKAKKDSLVTVKRDRVSKKLLVQTLAEKEAEDALRELGVRATLPQQNE